MVREAGACQGRLDIWGEAGSSSIVFEYLDDGDYPPRADWMFRKFMSPCDLCEGNPFPNLEASPAGFQCGGKIRRCSRFRLFWEIVTSEEI